MPTGFLGVLAVVRFLAELGMLVALGLNGWWLAEDSVALSVVLALLLPAAAAFTWGTWVAPRASRRLADPGRFAVEVTLFGLAFLGLASGPAPYGMLWGVALWAAFLVSAPVGRKGF